MSKVSYSCVSKFTQCPYLYRLLYIDHLKPLFDESATNALHLGTCIHEGIESRDINHAEKLYTEKYSIWDINNEIELLKLKTILPKALTQIPEGEYEYKIDVDDEFVGYIDCLVKIDEGVYDMYDFKYATSAKRYEDSSQVHLYKYYYELTTGNKIRNMYYAVIPKCKETLKDMDENSLKEMIINSYSKKDIELVPIEYNPFKINQFKAQKKLLDSAKSFPKVYSSKCMWCQFQKYCRSNGQDKSEIEKAEEQKGIVEGSLF